MVVGEEDAAMAGTMAVVEEAVVGGGDVEEEEVGGTITITMIDVKVVDRRRDRIIGGRNRHQHKRFVLVGYIIKWWIKRIRKAGEMICALKCYC